MLQKDFLKIYGIDYNETFAPITKMNTIKIIITLIAKFDRKIHQMDVKSAFLNGDLKEEIYMSQPPGFIENSNLVYKFKKSIYSLKQAPRAWYTNVDDYLIHIGYTRCISDLNLYFKHDNENLTILIIYVDDIIITGSSIHDIHHLKSTLMNKLEMTNLDLLHYFLCLQVYQNQLNITLSQPKYILDLIQ